SSPPMMMLAPMPVPTATSMRSRYPRAAPNRASAQAEAFETFSTSTSRPSRPEADRLDLVPGQQLGHHVGDGLLGPRRTGRRSRPLQLGEDLAVFIDHPCRDLRATDVNADGERHGAVSPRSGAGGGADAGGGGTTVRSAE